MQKWKRIEFSERPHSLSFEILAESHFFKRFHINLSLPILRNETETFVENKIDESRCYQYVWAELM